MPKMQMPKNTIALLLSALFLLSLCACRQSVNAPPTEIPSFDPTTENAQTSTDTASSTPEQTAPAPNAAALKSLKSVLQNEAGFFDTHKDSCMDLTQFIQWYIDRNIPNEIKEFAVCDLDGDGTPEVILWDRVNGNDSFGFEVLHYHEEVVYGYRFYYRGLNCLKTDGTFTFSAGASNSGVGTAIFTEKTYFIDKITYCESSYDSNQNKSTFYYVDRESATRDDYDTAISIEDKKPDVTWYDFSDENIVSVFPDE